MSTPEQDSKAISRAIQQMPIVLFACDESVTIGEFTATSNPNNKDNTFVAFHPNDYQTVRQLIATGMDRENEYIGFYLDAQVKKVDEAYQKWFRNTKEATNG